MRASEADFVCKLIRASVTNHFNYDVLGSLHATAQTRNTPLKILKIQCWKVNAQIRIAMSFSIKLNFVALVRERTMPTERPPLVGEVVQTFADRGCREVSTTDSHGSLTQFSRPEPLLVLPSNFSVVLTRLSGPRVPDPLILRKSGSAGNRTQEIWNCSQKLWPF
jgi:hypothetical protein